MNVRADDLRPMSWEGDARDGVLRLLDQRLLPGEERWLMLRSVEEVAKAIYYLCTDQSSYVQGMLNRDGGAPRKRARCWARRVRLR